MGDIFIVYCDESCHLENETVCLTQQLKANAVQTFEARNQGRDKAQQIVFRTV